MRILQGPRPHVESQSLSNKTGLIKKHEWSQRMRKKEISGVVWLWMVVLYLELLTFLLDCLPLPRVGGVMEGDNGREKELARERHSWSHPVIVRLIHARFWERQYTVSEVSHWRRQVSKIVLLQRLVITRCCCCFVSVSTLCDVTSQLSLNAADNIFFGKKTTAVTFDLSAFSNLLLQSEPQRFDIIHRCS